MKGKRKRSAWFAFYVDDYSGGTRAMSLAAKGAFVDLLGYQFQNGSVPNDDRVICRILGAMPDEWESVKGEVLSKFDLVDSVLINPRMDIERSEREDYRAKAAENGAKGGRPPKTQPFTSGKPNGNPTLSENGTQSEPEPKASTSTSTSTPEHEVSSPSGSHPDKSGKARERREEAELIYQAYPRKIAKKDGMRAIEKALVKIPFADLLDATTAYAQSRIGQDPSVTPYPATWFNAERYHDDRSQWNLPLFNPRSNGKPSNDFVD